MWIDISEQNVSGGGGKQRNKIIYDKHRPGLKKIRGQLESQNNKYHGAIFKFLQGVSSFEIILVTHTTILIFIYLFLVLLTYVCLIERTRQLSVQMQTTPAYLQTKDKWRCADNNLPFCIFVLDLHSSSQCTSYPDL